MVTVDEAIIAKYEKDGKHFEVMVDPEIAYDLREGKSVSVQKMLAVNHIYSDSKKANKATPSDIEKAFGTQDVEKIAELIVKKGEIQLTTDFRRKKVEERRLQIADIISRNAINPQTRTPHPQQRILAAMDQTRFHADPFKPADQQVEDVVKAIREILPISITELILTVEIPARYAARAYGALKEFGIMQEKWQSDGSLVVKITIPAGIKENVYRKFGNLTEGNARIDEEDKK
jgi:ribosome maturation protein SDO1